MENRFIETDERSSVEWTRLEEVLSKKKNHRDSRFFFFFVFSKDRSLMRVCHFLFFPPPRISVFTWFSKKAMRTLGGRIYFPSQIEKTVPVYLLACDGMKRSEKLSLLVDYEETQRRSVLMKNRDRRNVRKTTGSSSYSFFFSSSPLSRASELSGKERRDCSPEKRLL